MSTSHDARHVNYQLGTISRGTGNASTDWIGGWCPSVLDTNQWIEFRSDTVREWVAIDTQGRNDGDQWVTGFKVFSSLDGVIWKAVENGRIFPGNTDRNTVLRTTFAEPVYGNVLRINPVTWNNWFCLRIEAYFLRK
eukprot:TRINITY_DN25154_c0_g1_i1.p1 TRINITY_DN25154_c0_g1~~TRINITY_DN25154_c0_g1_i1.p1  ORF type:complete len:137 (-),score=10.37 TRINITY_DN25154_c0_g1_i1:109-519(-)